MFSWIKYSVEKNAVFCFPCWFFSPTGDNAFTRIGFRDWKRATGKFGILMCHDSKCTTHRDAVVARKQFKLSKINDASIGVLLDGKKVIQDNRQYFKDLLECLLFCAQQGIALRGHRESMEDLQDPSMNHGNFRSLDNDVVSKHLEEGPHTATWLGNHIQNELVQVMAEAVLSSITAEVKEAGYFTIIADEMKDISKREQLAIVLICLQWDCPRTLCRPCSCTQT